MAITSADVVTEEDFANVVRTATEESRGFREAFMDYPVNAGEGPTVDILQMPDGNDFFDDDEADGDVHKIGELSEYPRADPEKLSTRQVSVEKEGFETAISDEAVGRGKVPEQLRLAAEMSRTYNKYLDNIAGSMLLANVNDTTAGDGNNDSVTWENLVRARTILRNADYEPTHLFHEPLGSETLLLNPDITSRSTDMSDDAIRTGSLPPLLGLETVEVTTGLDDYEAVMVDRDRYGVEATEDLMSNIESYRMDEKDGTAYKLREFKGWKVHEADAAVKING
jgi:hypothetical protein